MIAGYVFRGDSGCPDPPSMPCESKGGNSEMTAAKNNTVLGALRTAIVFAALNNVMAVSLLALYIRLGAEIPLNIILGPINLFFSKKI
jgi:hypothetical protein